MLEDEIFLVLEVQSYAFKVVLVISFYNKSDWEVKWLPRERRRASSHFCKRLMPKTHLKKDMREEGITRKANKKHPKKWVKCSVIESEAALKVWVT